MASRLFHRAARRPAHGRTLTRLLVPLVAGLLGGCDPYVVGNGVQGERSFSVGSFEGIRLEDAFAAIVTVDPAATKSVRITGDENVLQHVQVTVEQDASRGMSVLRVRVNLSGGFDPAVPLNLIATVPSLRYLAASGAKYPNTDVSATGVQAPDFEVEAAEGFQVSLRGTGATLLRVRLAGGPKLGPAKLFAKEFAVPNADVALSQGAIAELLVGTAVTGTLTGASQLTNFGLGTCSDGLVADPSSTVTCAGGVP